MKISNDLIFKHGLLLSVLLIVVTLLVNGFLKTEYFNSILWFVLLLLVVLLFFFKSFNEIVLDEDGIYFHDKTMFHMSTSSKKKFISFSYLQECKIIYGYPIVLSLKYFENNGKLCFKKFKFFIHNKIAIEFEYRLNRILWGVE